MFFLLARDTDGSLRLLSGAIFETRREALDELAKVAGDSASFSEPEEVFLGDLDAVSPVLLVRVAGTEVGEPAPSVEGFPEASHVEPVYAEAVLADLGTDTTSAEEPAEPVEEALLEAAVFAPAAEEPAPESSTWPWVAGLAEAPEAGEAAEPSPLPESMPVTEEISADMSWMVPLESEIQAAIPEPVPVEAEQPVEAYEPPAYEEPAVDAVSLVPPAEDVYVPRPVIMGDYADEHVSGWNEIREPKGVTEAESGAVDPFAAVEAPATEAEDLPGDLGHEHAVVEEPSFTEQAAPLTDSSIEEPTATSPEETPDPGLPMWRPETPSVPPADTPVAESPEAGAGFESFEEPVPAPAETEPMASAPAQSKASAYMEVPEEASAAFPGLQAFFASRGVTPDVQSVPSGMPREEQPAGSGSTLAPEDVGSDHAEDVPGYELGGSDLATSTCEDCVYVNTCPKAHQSTPAECGSFQWKAV